MKQYVFLILVLFLLPTMFLMGCRGTITVSEKALERDKAVAFYKGAYPITKEIRAVADDWNVFYMRALQRKASLQEISNMAQKCESRLRAQYNDLSMLYSPPPLRQLKDDIALVLNTGIETFMLLDEGIVTGDSDKLLQADKKLLELNRLMVTVADEWDDGLAHYNIKPSEFLP